MECDLPTLCEEIKCLQGNQDLLWDKVFGNTESVYLATGNMGVPTNYDSGYTPVRYTRDLQEYNAGALIVRHIDPKGLFITGDANYDYIDQFVQAYPNWKQEAKIVNGFSELLLKQRIYPVMGDNDYWIVQNTVGDITVKMERAYLRMFPYLSDAKRYYSVYDQKSNTQFFILSSGRYKDPISAAAGFVYPNDISMADSQYAWLVQATSASPARNKVVIFHHPFVSISNTFQETTGQGAANVFTDFANWDFESMGIKLIINGHAGGSFHLRKGSIDIVNSSAFIRSRMGLVEVPNNAEPPVLTTIYGKQGYAVEYFSHHPMGTNIPNIEYPTGSSKYVAPKNELFKMTCTNAGITCEFVSYDPLLSSYKAIVDSMKVEHTFEISALE